MAALTTEQKRVIANRFVKRAYRDLNKTADMTSEDIIAATQSVETFIADNQTAFNAILPSPFKENATLAEKTLIFCYVAMQQAGLI